MKLKNLGTLGALLVSAGLPIAAQAQTGVIITAPSGQPAPALGGPMLMLLAATLGLLAVRYLRSRELNAAAALAGVLSLTAVVAGAIPTIGVTVSGGECDSREHHFYNSSTGNTVLLNDCAGPIRIESVDECNDDNSSCTESLGDEGSSDTIASCAPGLVVPPEGICFLPACSGAPECL